LTRRKFNLPTNDDKKNEKILKTVKITCTGTCGKEKAPSQFYISSNPLYKSTGRFPVCKTCITDRLPDYRVNQQSDLYKVIQDRGFVTSVLGLLKSMNYPFLLKQWTTAINEAEKNGKHVFGLYMKHLAQVKESLTYDDGEVNLSSDDICKLSINRGMTPSTLEDEKKEEKKKAKKDNLKFDDSELTITDEDLELQKDIIRLLGYDPFVEYSGFDRKQMYQDIIPYLDEDTLEDQFLISIVTQIVKSNHQIKKVDDAIATLGSTVEDLKINSVEIDRLTKIKKILQESVNTIAKENSIAVKHRSDSGLKKSTLGYKMKHYRELGFKDAEENFYDMNTSRGMQISSDISVKSIFNQLKLTESDYADIIQKQTQDCLQLNNKVLELEEEIRVYNVIIDAYVAEYGKNKELIEYEEK